MPKKNNPQKKSLFMEDKNYVDSFYLKIFSSILSFSLDNICFNLCLKLLKLFSIYRQFRDF